MKKEKRKKKKKRWSREGRERRKPLGDVMCLSMRILSFQADGLRAPRASETYESCHPFLDKLRYLTSRCAALRCAALRCVAPTSQSGMNCFPPDE